MEIGNWSGNGVGRRKGMRIKCGGSSKRGLGERRKTSRGAFLEQAGDMGRGGSL